MINFTAIIKKFDEKGEKTGWTYIDIPQALANKIKPGTKTAFRVKGMLDSYSIEQVSLVPIGEGNFIMAINAGMRKALGKHKGEKIKVSIELDDKKWAAPKWFLDCMEDDETAITFFKNLPASHQRYYLSWIESAKTQQTKDKRAAQAIMGFARGMGYGELIRYLKANRDELGENF
jgi:Domain of unknown function (DUF1905)/Bacteriocin-protection, YdeI or OmpD-Associated